MMDITPIVKAVFVLLAFAISARLIPFIKIKTTAQQQAEINEWVRIAVSAAEQIFVGPGRGAQKKEYVISWLADHNIKLDENVVDALIESAVYELKNGFITIGEGAE